MLTVLPVAYALDWSVKAAPCCHARVQAFDVSHGAALTLDVSHLDVSHLDVSHLDVSHLDVSYGAALTPRCASLDVFLSYQVANARTHVFLSYQVANARTHADLKLNRGGLLTACMCTRVRTYMLAHRC